MKSFFSTLPNGDSRNPIVLVAPTASTSSTSQEFYSGVIGHLPQEVCSSEVATRHVRTLKEGRQ